MTRQRSMSERILRALIRILPTEFRGDFGAAMAADLDERGAMNGRSSVWGRELRALLTLAVREHLNVFRGDVKYARRMMGRAPAFTALAVVMLALGTGVNVAMFTVIDAVMLRSPFSDPERLAIVRVAGQDGRPTAYVPIEQFEALVASPRTLAAVAAFGRGSHVLTGGGDPGRPDLECVSAGMFDVLGTRPLLGRTFTQAEDRRGAAPTIVLSFDFWQQHLGARADVLGATLRLNDTPVTVIGVMPRGFGGPFSRSDASGWLPLGVTLTGNALTGCQTGSGVNVFARVRKELSLREAEAALPGVGLVSLSDSTLQNLRTPFLILAAAVGCVLLIACLNVGGLQLERAVARRHEMALRLALGASRARIVRQTVTEHLLLASIAAAAGLAATVVTLRSLVSLLPANMPHLTEIEVNGRVLLAAVAAAGVSGVISAIVPTLQTYELSQTRVLGTASRATTRRNHWTQRGLVVAQIALTMVVLIGAGLMIQTFLILRPSHPGFEPAGQLTTLVRLPGATPEASARFFQALFDRARTISGVFGVSGSSYLPMTGTVSTTPVTLDENTVNAFGAVIMSEYLRQMQIPVIAGRGFTANDTLQSAPVAIVNELLARRLRADGAVLGERVLAPGPRREGKSAIKRQIVGVIANTRVLGSHTRPAAEFYVPYAQSPIPVLNLILQTDIRQKAAVSSEVRRAIRELDPNLVVEPIEPLADMLNERVASPRFGAWLLGTFAGIAVILSAIGMMTTLGWWVSQRTRELGIRVSLGASRAQVTRLVFRQGATLGGGGIAAGCLIAMGVTRYLQGWIYGVTPMDRGTFAGAAILMLLIAAAAMFVPMRRAINVDPAVVLKIE